MIQTIESSRAKLARDPDRYEPIREALEASSVEDCVFCGYPLGPFNAQAGYGSGSFRWGFVNGEGTCGVCDFPYRFFHRIPDGDGEFFLMAFLPLAELPEEAL